MEIKFFASTEALSHLSLDMQFQRIKEAGYDGVELHDLDKNKANVIVKLLRTYGLLCIGKIATSGENSEDHADSFREQLYSYTKLNPILVNSLTGKDYFTFSENMQLLNEAMTLEKSYGIKVVHEMQRGRFSFAAHATERYLSLLPDLKIAANFSQWCLVADSYLEDQQSAVSKAIKQSFYIKCEWAENYRISSKKSSKAMQKHADEKFLYWWHRIIQYQDNKVPVLPITIPYGSKFLMGQRNLKSLLGAR